MILMLQWKTANSSDEMEQKQIEGKRVKDNRQEYIEKNGVE